MKERAFNLIMVVLGLGTLILIYGIVNIDVSKKYETDGDCISNVDGVDLCTLQHRVELYLILTIFTIVLLLIFHKKLLK